MFTNNIGYRHTPRKLTYFYSTRSLEFEIEKFRRNCRKTSFCSRIHCNSCPYYPSCPYHHEVVYGSVNIKCSITVSCDAGGLWNQNCTFCGVMKLLWNTVQGHKNFPENLQFPSGSLLGRIYATAPLAEASGAVYILKWTCKGYYSTYFCDFSLPWYKLSSVIWLQQVIF